jgi:hypothetical protein
MLSAATLLSIIDKLLTLAVMALDKASPDQVQALLERHERRLAFFEGLLEKVRGAE